jgi:DNA invertase Pin-like site-specific DNA recombinase
MMKAAHRGAFDLVLVWSLDRFGRSMAGNVNAVLELDRKGVEVVSVRETWLDTTGPTRSLLVAIMSWVAEQERIRLGERTRAGLERARRQGKSVGRPAKRIDWNAVDMLARKRYSVAEIAKALGVGRSTLLRAAAARRRDESRKGGVPEGGRSP